MDIPHGGRAELAFAASPGGFAPQRVPNSVRRTTSIDMHWPLGRDASTHIIARARDALTHGDGQLEVIDQAAFDAEAFITRELISVDCVPPDQRMANLSGIRAGGQLRAKLRELFPSSAEQETALYLLLDDLAGATLVSSWGWFAWDGYSRALADRIHQEGVGGNKGDMRGVCIGFAHGSTSIDDKGHPFIEEQNSVLVPSLIDPADTLGWHDVPTLDGPASRRARWIQVTREGGMIHVAAGFQDSAARQDGLRQAIHEYRLTAAIEAESGRIDAIEATPHVLPHLECPAAVLNVRRLLGRDITQLRSAVPELLAREEGCTHLNDVLRALVAVPALARGLPLQG